MTLSLNPRSLRVRLCLWYVFLSMVSMAALGAFSYIYLNYALASSRQQTMERRETRLLRYLQDEPATQVEAELSQELRHFMQANSDTDILELQDLAGRTIYPASPDTAMIAWQTGDPTHPRFQVIAIGRHRYRTLQQIVDIRGRSYRLTMAGMVDEHYDILRMVETSYLIFLPLMLVVSIAGGFMLSHRALEPVDRITRSAHRISIRDLSHRLPVPNTGDELQHLAQTWNELMERLEGAVKSLRQFTGDLSHDLRTSITVMLSTSQLALRRERSCEEYRESLETIMAESQSTAALLDDLLAASQSDMAKQRIEVSILNLGVLVAECCDHVRARAELKTQQLHLHADSSAWVAGDASLLKRLVNILLDNALKYTGEGGVITASVRCLGQHATLEIRDTGIGIPMAEVTKIFHRFYRGDSSRNRDQGGNGLGLAIAKWITEAHRTQILVSANAPSGSIFAVDFELAASPETERQTMAFAE